MTRAVILPDSYITLLEYEGINSGILTNVLRREEHPDVDFDYLDKSLKEDYNRYRNQKQKFYQMILLYDDLVIPQADSTIDYGNLVPYGFSVYALEDSLSYDPMGESGYKDLATIYKPAIVKRLVSLSKDNLVLSNPEISARKTASILYDYSLKLREMEPNDMLVIDRYRDYCISFMTPELRRIEEKVNYKYIFGEAPYLFSDLCWQLNVSADHNAYIINSDYDLSSFRDDNNRQSEAYRILKVSYNETIGKLPGFNSLQEVFSLKQTKKKELRQLRMEIDNLETILLSSNPDREEQARDKAIKDIKKATDAVNKGLPVINRISTWTSIVGVPIGVIEYFTGQPILGGIITATSGIMALAGINAEKNRWCEIIR